VTIDKCSHCNGTFLDAGELEKLAGKESDLLNRIVSVFKR
jgi:Zn-finger nucleic acid-binding protein